MRYKKSNFICVLDTETTNVYWNTCAPIQIAAEICDAEGRIVDTFNERIKTTHRIDPGASEVHGIYAEDLVNCRKESEVIYDFCAWMQNWNCDMILTYNGETFDRPMLNLRCQLFKIDTPYFDKDKYGVDVYARDVKDAKKKDLFGLKSLGRKWKLTLVSELLGISTEHAHDALADVDMTRQVFYKLDPLIHPEDWEE